MTTTEIDVQRRPVGALAVSDGQTEWRPEQWAALEHLGIAEAPRGAQILFLSYAQRTGLDPFAKQIYLRKRRSWEDGGYVEKWNIEGAIDGFRVAARRAADRKNESYGYEEPLWCGSDRKWVDVWVDDQHPPTACKFVVKKTKADGRVELFPATAKYTSYVQKNRKGEPSNRWASAPDQMLCKCAEALALRMAYPNDLSGVYTGEEMGQADNPPVDVTATAHVGPTEQQQADWSDEWYRRFDAATTLDDLARLGRLVRGAEDSGHCPKGQGDTYRNLLRGAAAGMPADEAHLTRVHAALAERHVTDREDKLGALSRIVGRRLASSAELTCAEADDAYRQIREALPGLDLVTGEMVPPGVGVDADGVPAGATR